MFFFFNHYKIQINFFLKFIKDVLSMILDYLTDPVRFCSVLSFIEFHLKPRSYLNVIAYTGL